MPPGELVIIGASVRAAVASAQRARWRVKAVDLFADRDLLSRADCRQCPPDDYPHGLFTQARSWFPAPWFYTGGIENHPELIEEFSHFGRLIGNSATVVRAVRDPFLLHDFLKDQGFNSPRISRDTFQSYWLRKPYRGSAGFGISRAEGMPESDRFYFQEFIPGTPCSALYLVGLGKAQLLGITQQIIGDPAFHAPEFRYAGNMGPISDDEAVTKTLAHLGQMLVERFGMSHFFGVDFIRNDQSCYILEVNPRYTASLEVLERAYRCNLFFQQALRLPAAQGVIGKAIYYAPRRFVMPATGPWDKSLTIGNCLMHWPDYADIPPVGAIIEPGEPVMTIFSEARTPDECRDQLIQRADELDQLGGTS